MDRFKNVVLRKCKSLSSRVGRPSASSASSSYCNLRSMSTRDAATAEPDNDAAVEPSSSVEPAGAAVVFVGSSRRRYVISAEHLSHPLIAALLIDPGGGAEDKQPIAVNCEVVLFDHLLWMLDNAADLHAGDDANDAAAMRELAQLYAC